MRSLWIFALLAACTQNTKPPICNKALGGAGGGAAGIDLEYRDPSTGQCQSFSNPTYPCDPACGQECPEYGAGTDVALPDWGMCYGSCDNLTEDQCLASSSCHAAYQDSPTPSPTFWGCWELPPSGAITGACAGLDAQTCSEHPDCVSTYTSPVNSGPDFVEKFESCGPKSMAALCGGVDCGAGNECVVTPTMPAQQMCEPTSVGGTCDTAACATPAPGCPSGTTPGVANGCYTNYCIPTSSCPMAACSTLTEQQCTARSDCDAVYMGSNCTCDRNGCTCQTETYLRCQ